MGIAPVLRPMGGQRIEVHLADGTEKTLACDEAYLRRAILDPSAEVVDGFEDMMSSYEGEIHGEDLAAIVGYLMTGETATAPTVHPGLKIADEEGCTSCHTTDGTPDVGPSFKDLYGSTRTVTAAMGGARQVTADELYLKDSILSPSKLITEGYDDGMPPYEGMDPERLNTLIDWLRTLSSESGS